MFDIFDTLIYLGVSSKTSFYQILEKEFQISHFSEMRERAEREAIGKARLKGKEITINNIYQQLKKYTGINVEEGVNKEIEVLKRISYSNIYIKNFYDMLSYSMDNIVAIDSTYYSSEQIKEVLMNKGYSKLKKIFVSNEICKAKDDGNMFPYISAELISDKIIYMGSERHKNDLAKKNGWHIWEYRNANECGNKYRPIGMSGIKADSYSAIINQHMYCGHYQHSQRRELGYKYFGVLTIGFLNWLREQCKKSAITRIEFIFGTSNILKDNYDSCYMGDGIKSDTLFFSEETAVRCLVDIEPTCFFEYYIDRKINGEYTISFYIERMGLSAIENRLVEYGIKTTDIMSLNGEIYWAFLDFIGDNLTDIKSQYEEEICAVCQYLTEKRYETEKIGVVNIRGQGYIAKALSWLLNERLNIKCEVKEFTAFQTLKFEDAAYLNGTASAFISSNIIVEGLSLPINIDQANYFESVFSDKVPRLSYFYLNKKGQYQTRFDDACPWKYDAITEIQRGIKDFINDYRAIWKDDFEMLNIGAGDMILILRNITVNNEYLETHIPIVLV